MRGPDTPGAYRREVISLPATVPPPVGVWGVCPPWLQGAGTLPGNVAEIPEGRRSAARALMSGIDGASQAMLMMHLPCRQKTLA